MVGGLLSRRKRDARTTAVMRSLVHPVAAQVALVVLGLAGLAAAPPARGAMWLVPLTQGARGQVARLALAGDAQLVAEGPVAGSLVVRADRARLLRPLLASGVLVLAAPPAGCGPVADGVSRG